MLHEYLIRKEDAEVFGGLIPPAFREELERGSLYGVVTFDDLIIPDRLVGVTLVRVRYDWQEIVWVALNDGYQGPEYAADLIRIRTESARERGVLTGTFSEFPVQEAVRADYFACAGFSYEKIPSRVYSIAIDFGAGGTWPLPAEDEGRIFRLRQMTELQKEQLQQLFVESARPLPLEIPVDWAKYDPDATIFYLRDGVIESCLFMIKHPGFYALESVFGIETPGSFALLGYYAKYGTELFGDRKSLLIPVFMYSVEKYMRNNPHATAGEISLTWSSYKTGRTKRGYLTVESYIKNEDSEALGLDLLDAYDGYPEYPKWGRNSLIGSEEFYCVSARETEAVYERYWEKMEACARSKGIPTMVLIRRRIAYEAFELCKSGNVPAYKISKLRLTGKQPAEEQEQSDVRSEDYKRPPVSVRERTVKATLIAGLFVGREEAEEAMKVEPGNGLTERAEYAAKTELIKVMGDALRSYLALAGVDIVTGKQIKPDELGALMRKSPGLEQKLSKLTEDFSTEVVRRMVGEIEQEEDFKKELREQIDLMSEADSRVIEAKWAQIRDLPNFAQIRESFERAMAELKKQMAAMTELSIRIAVLGKRKELADYRDIMYEELFSSQIRTISYYIDSIECYLQYLLDGTPIGAMHGVFIREKLESDVPCPDPNVVLEDQIVSLSPAFEGLAPWETDRTTIFGSWQQMQRRKNGGCSETDDVRTVAGKNEPGDVTLEECRERVRELERKKNSHPELFRELMIIGIFEELPELTELFGEAYEARNAVAKLYREHGGSGTGEIKDLYLRVNALFNTLLRRACYITKASRMTMKELLTGKPDYYPSDYENSLREMKYILSEE